MKSTELRIGNLVQYNGNLKETGKITTIFQDFISGSDYCQINYRNNKKHWLINIEPIPLTEELLLKMGFEARNDIFYKFGVYPHTISLNKNGDSYRVEVVCQSIAWIKHVHQLQNLYFALTGCELEIKLLPS